MSDSRTAIFRALAAAVLFAAGAARADSTTPPAERPAPPAVTAPAVPAAMAAPMPAEDRAKAAAMAERLAAWRKDGPAYTGKLYVFYVCMSDLDPHPDYAARLDRVLKEIQGFYRMEMEANGFGPLTFPLETDKDGRLVVHVARSQKPKSAFDRASGHAILDEIRPIMKAAGIDPARSTILILTPLPEGAPYYGGGTFRSGCCWATDFPHLDPLRFADKTPLPGNAFHRNVGQDNTVYIGGMAHELGHAFGLPHNNDRPQTARPGTSLMGAGNYTFRQELRGEGKGSFLSPADAARLASAPLFSSSLRGADNAASCRFTGLDAVQGKDGDLVVSGRITASPETYAVVAYNDAGECAGQYNSRTKAYEDYDSNTFTAVPDKDGRFSVRIKFRKTDSGYGLRLTACHLNGATTTLSGHYTVRRDGRADLAEIRMPWLFAESFGAIAAGRRTEAAAVLKNMETSPGNDAVVKAWAARFRAMLAPEGVRVPPSAVPAGTKTVLLSACAWESARTGWGRPLRDHVLPEEQEFPLQVNHEWRESGLFAHAPANHQFNLGGAWKTFTAQAGVQDGHGGKVQFRIFGDGKRLAESPVLGNGKPHAFSVPVEGVEKLELQVTDGGDSSSNDWAVWLDPKLER